MLYFDTDDIIGKYSAGVSIFFNHNIVPIAANVLPVIVFFEIYDSMAINDKNH
jgi:hypothetical protein